MRKIFLTTIFLVLAVVTFPEIAYGQKVEYIKVPELEKILNNPANRLFVVNFWATWCPPCVKELPHFEKVSRDYDPGKVQFIMISLDFPSQVEKQLIPFLQKNNITLPVSAMMETDANLWIEKIDPDWQGNIPVTLLFNNARKIRNFHPGELDESGLRNMINQYL